MFVAFFFDPSFVVLWFVLFSLQLSSGVNGPLLAPAFRRNGEGHVFTVVFLSVQEGVLGPSPLGGGAERGAGEKGRGGGVPQPGPRTGQPLPKTEPGQRYPPRPRWQDTSRTIVRVKYDHRTDSFGLKIRWFKQFHIAVPLNHFYFNRSCNSSGK